MMIALKMHEISPWVTVGRCTGIVILIIAGLVYIFSIFEKYQNESKTKSRPMKVKRY